MGSTPVTKLQNLLWFFGPFLVQYKCRSWKIGFMYFIWTITEQCCSSNIWKIYVLKIIFLFFKWRFNAVCGDSTQTMCHLQSCLEQWKHFGNMSCTSQFLCNSLRYYILWTKMHHPSSEKAWTIYMVQVPTHTNYQTMLMDESVMLKYNFIIIESNWLAAVCNSSGSNSQHS